MISNKKRREIHSNPIYANPIKNFAKIDVAAVVL